MGSEVRGMGIGSSLIVEEIGIVQGQWMLLMQKEKIAFLDLSRHWKSANIRCGSRDLSGLVLASAAGQADKY